MKQIDKLVTSSFIGPYLMSFFVAEFVLIMQFLWKYIDDILGKGFTIFELLELIFYYGVTIIPMAVPIAILISSVMVFGNMSERYELSSMKSAGVSLLRVMMYGILISILTALFSLLASNYLKPKANYKFQSRFSAIRKQKPSLSIEEGIFNKDFKGYVIRVDEKGSDDKSIKDVMIYDHTDVNKSLINLVKADEGEMFTTEDGRFFVMNLRNGEQVKEMRSKPKKDKSGGKTYPLVRTSFERWTKAFDMSEFEFDEESLNINRNKEDMLNTFQILEAIDSMHIKEDDLVKSSVDNFDGLSYIDVKESEFNKDVFDRRGRDYQPMSSSEIAKRKAKAAKAKSTKTNTNQTNSASKNSERISKVANASQRSNVKKSISNRNIKLQKISQLDTVDLKSIDSFLETLDTVDRRSIINGVVNHATSKRDYTGKVRSQLNSFHKKEGKYKLRLHQQYSWALICIIFMFIGGPMGSIIRKGGYGYPLLMAILFYMVFIISSISGEKLLKKGELGPELAAWLPCMILFPLAIFLTSKAIRDAKFVSIKEWGNRISILFSYLKVRKS